MVLKENGRQKPKKQQYIKCKNCGTRILITEENLEKIADVLIVYCECGQDMEL